MNATHNWWIVTAAALLVSGCGKPPAGDGRHGDGPVTAVIAEASAEEVSTTADLVGNLRARYEIDVRSELNGTIAEVGFSEGDAVEKGQALILFDDTKFRARAAEARARLNLARANHERARTLLESETISEQEYDTAKAEYEAAEAAHDLLRDELDDTTIEAAFDGLVGERMISPGQYVSVGQVLTRLVQMDPLDIVFSVPEVHLARLSKGQQVRFTSPAFPGSEITGEVFFVDPYIDPVSRTVMAKAEVANPDRTLRPGLFGRARLVLSVNDSAVVIPEASVRYSGEEATVVVMNAEDKSEIRQVTVGSRMSNRVEIVSGIAAGERVVVEGHQKIFMPGTSIAISPDSARFGIEPEAAPDESDAEAPAGNPERPQE